MLFVAVVLALLLFVLVSNRCRPSYVFFLALFVFYVTGYISTKSLLSAFLNPAILSIALLLLISQVLKKSLLFQGMGRYLLSSKTLPGTMFKLSCFTVITSAFVSNTAVVATLLEVIDKSKTRFSVSKIYLPLSFLAIMGGTLTLIGSSTNMIMNGLLEAQGVESIGFFDFFYIGFWIVLVGTVYIVFFAHRVLDNKLPDISQSPEKYFLEAKVSERSDLVGKTVLQNKLRNLEELFLAEVIRGDEVISPVSPQQVIEAQDILVFTGDVRHINELKKFDGLEFFEGVHENVLSNIKEVVVAQGSTLVGKRIKEANFRSHFDAAIVAVRRGSERLSGKIGLVEIRPGDRLILAVGPGFYEQADLNQHFYLIDDVNLRSFLSVPKSILVFSLFVLALLATVFGWVSLFKSMLVVFVAFLLFGCASLREFKQNHILDLVLLLGSATGVTYVLQSSGFAQSLVSSLLTVLGQHSPMIGLVTVYVVSFFLTQFITNLGGAVLMFPLAMALAQSFSASPVPFLFAVIFGASCSFLTPYAYQTNIMVYSVGGYDQKDFYRVGWPLAAIYSVVALVAISYFFPF